MQCAKKTLSPLITHVSNDAGDIEALTPNHFLLLRANSSNEETEVGKRERDQPNEIMATVSSAC